MKYCPSRSRYCILSLVRELRELPVARAFQALHFYFLTFLIPAVVHSFDFVQNVYPMKGVSIAPCNSMSVEKEISGIYIIIIIFVKLSAIPEN
jgi:hypothetical protein